MKILTFLACLVLLASAGCRSLPNAEADHWVHSGSYGVVTTHYEATAVVKKSDGNLHVGTYTGSITVLGGYGVSDTIQGLTITPAAKTETPLPSPAK